MRTVHLTLASRRSAALLLTLAVVPGAAGMVACSPDDPTPDAGLQGISADLRALSSDGALDGNGIFAAQADLVDAEVLRECGTRDGESPAGCATPAQAPADVPDIDKVRTEMMNLIGTGGGDRAVLLTGLHAALATVEDADAGGPAIDSDITDAGFTDGSSDALGRATELVDQAVYLTGVVLPVAGDSSGTVSAVGSRLRGIRDAVAQASGVDAAPGYTFADGAAAPTDRNGAVTALLQAVHDVTVELRRAVGSLDGADRETAAMWAAVSARCEAALEDQLGTDPLTVTVRGQ